MVAQSTKGKQLLRRPCQAEGLASSVHKRLRLQLGRQQGQADQEGAASLHLQLVKHGERQQHGESKGLLRQGERSRFCIRRQRGYQLFHSR